MSHSVAISLHIIVSQKKNQSQNEMISPRIFLILLLLFYIDGGLTHCSRSKPLLVFIFQINEFPTYDCDFSRVNCQYMGVWCSISIVFLHITLFRNQLMMDRGPLCCELGLPPPGSSEMI